MGRSITKPKSKIYKTQGTIFDKRLKRSTALSRLKCPSCFSSTIVEKKSRDDHVWGYCTYCKLSGEKNKVKDNSLIEACDIIFTLTDTLCGI